MKGKNMTTRTLKTVARSFKASVKGEDTARMTAAALAFEYVVTLKGKSADLAAESGITPGKVSKHVTAGKALALVPDADDETRRNIVRTAHGEAGDRPALVEAIKAESASGVVAAVKNAGVTQTGNKSRKNGRKGSKGKAVPLKDMDTEALIGLLIDATEILATRDDMPGENADKFAKFAKSAGLIAKNLQKVPVA